MKKRLIPFICTAWAMLQTVTFAADQDLFEEGTDLITSITGSLTGDIAAAVLTLVVVIFGYACWMGKVSREWALKIVGGSLVVACAGGIAALIFGS